MSSSSLEQTANDLKVARLVINKLGETFDGFQLHFSSILVLAEQWRNLQSNFTAFDSLLVNRVRELEIKERDNGEDLIRLQNLYKQIEIRQTRLDLGEKSVSERVSAVEIREKDLKECYEVVEIEKKEIDERRKAVLLLERRLKDEISRVNVVEEREKEMKLEIERRCKAVELEEERVRELSEEMDRKGKEIERRCKAVVLEEVRVRELSEEMKRRDKEIERRCKAVELEEIRVRELSEEMERRGKEIERRCKSVELEEVRVRELSEELKRRDKEIERRCKAVELEEVRFRELSEELKERIREVELKGSEIMEGEMKIKEKEMNEVYEALELREKEMSEELKLLKSREIEVGLKKEEVKRRSQALELKEKDVSEVRKVLEAKEMGFNELCKALEAKEKEISVDLGRVKSKEKEVNVACERVGLKEKRLNERSEALKFIEKGVNEREKVLELKEKKMNSGFHVLELKEKEMYESYIAMAVKEREVEERCQEGREKFEKMVAVIKALKLKEDEIFKRCQAMVSSKGLELEEKIDVCQKAVELKEREDEESSHAGKVKVKQMDERAKAMELKKVEILKRYRERECTKGLKLKEKLCDDSHKTIESKDIKVDEGCQAGIAKVERVEKCAKASELDESSKALLLKEKVTLEVCQSEVLKKKRIDVPTEVMESKLKEIKGTSSTKVTSVIHLYCINMEARGVNSYLIGNVEKQNMLKETILDALSCAPDPAKLVLNVCHSFDRTNSDQVYGDASKNSCIFLLEQFVNLSPSITPTVKDDAKNLAAIWKSRKKGPADTLIFLLFVAAYNIASIYNPSELTSHLSLILNGADVYCLEKTIYLRHALGLEEHIPGHVKYLIQQQKWLMAVKYICVFKLESSFPPVHLLEAYLKHAKKRVEEKLSEGTRKAENTAIAMESSFLRDVVKCILNFKLESEFPPEALQLRLEQLKDLQSASNSALLGKRAATDSTSARPVKHQGKRPRVGTL